MTENNKIKDSIKSLPSKPGIYQFRDKKSEIIYIGKAKNLKKRVSSYFTKKNTGKTKILISRTVSVNIIIVDSEHEALLLENTLIKKYQPRYNVLLKDDKNFPWICIKNEPFPRVFSTRNKLNDGSEYFGPYTSALLVRTILDLLRQLYPIRTCSYKLSSKNIDNQKFKPCLEFHIGKCKAPCVGKQDEDEYNEIIKQIRSILKGNINELRDYLNVLMHKYSADYKYEEADYLKEKVEIISKYQSKSTVVSSRITDIDVFSIVDDDDVAYVNYLKVLAGSVVYSRSLELKRRLDESKEELITLAITEITQNMREVSRETLLPFMPAYSFPGMRIFIPKRGDKKRLLELSERNARYFMMERKRTKELQRNRVNKIYVLEKLRDDMRLKNIPRHIECFDNSNIQGKQAVAACVVFRNGKPKKSEYRHFNIKTVAGANDFASMKEVVFRRYKRMLDEKKSLPDMILVDGGKGQLRAAIDALEDLNIKGTIAVFGIAKRLEEIYVPGDPVPLYLDKNSSSLKIIQQLRNEAHRFGISFHRHKRSALLTKSELDSIKGIGPRTINKLLIKYKSIERIKKLKPYELKIEIGRVKSTILLKHFKNSSR